MTAHKLAEALLAGPDIPVVIDGWGSDEGSSFEVSDAGETRESFHGEDDSESTPGDRLGYKLDRPCITLGTCGRTDCKRPDSPVYIISKAREEA